MLVMMVVIMDYEDGVTMMVVVGDDGGNDGSDE